jgi:uncharacterized protein (DUF1330 family)
VTVYVIVQLKIIDLKGFTEYREMVSPQIAMTGGRGVARGAEVEKLEGDS